MGSNLSENLDTIHDAGLARRIAAATLDGLIIACYALVLLGVGIGVRATLGPLEQISSLFASPIAMDALAFLVLILPAIMYFVLQESSGHRATWGKHKAGISVVNANGGTLTKTRSFVRSLLKLLPWQIAHTCIFHIEGWPFAPVEPSPLVLAGFALVYLLAGVYVVSVLISRKHRTPYDRVVGSYVIVQTGP